MRSKPGVALIVDESLSARNLAKTLVQDALGSWTVLVARNADEALLQAASMQTIDVAIIGRNVVGGGASLVEALVERYPAIQLGCVTDEAAPTAAGITPIPSPLTERKVQSFVASLVHRSA